MVDARGFTVLSLAAYKGHEDLIKTLYAHGVDQSLRGDKAYK